MRQTFKINIDIDLKWKYINPIYFDIKHFKLETKNLEKHTILIDLGLF